MSVNVTLFLALLSLLSIRVASQWTWSYHGKPPVLTDLVSMRSGANSKLFGVGNGKLYERYWAGSHWVWANHGSPSGLQSNERIASRPCVLQDGKLFVITNKGRLVERHWHAGNWHWALHGKPTTSVGIRATTCACTTSGSVHRVFMVGNNFKLYERYWSGAWLWRYHGSPPGTTIGLGRIDTCKKFSCPTRVYVPALNGNLYYRYISGTSAGWINLGRPSGQNVHGVTVGENGAGVFIDTKHNYICKQISSWNYQCYGKPPGTTTNPSVAISKPVLVTNCGKLPGFKTHIFMHSWDPTYSRRARLYSLEVTGSSGIFKYHGSFGSCCYLIGAPEVFMNWSCPKVFTTTSHGRVYERYVQ